VVCFHDEGLARSSPPPGNSTTAVCPCPLPVVVARPVFRRPGGFPLRFARSLR
jgi:hypothetical protein